MHKRPGIRGWILIAVSIVLIGAHGSVLYLVSSHAALGAAAACGIILFVLTKHLGLLGSFATFWRRSRSPKKNPYKYL